MLSQDFYMSLDLYLCFVQYPVYINTFSKNCLYGLSQLLTEASPNIQDRFGTNFDISISYPDVSSVLSRSAEDSTQLFNSLYYSQNMVDQRC